MTTETLPASKTEPTLVMRRTLAAPRARVWAVLTDPAHVKRWYGGHGFENPVCEMDVRPGGRWHHVMRTPDGQAFTLDFVFVDVLPPEKLSWRNAHPAPPGLPFHENLVTVTLEEDGPRTRWTMVARFRSVADRDGAMGFGFAEVLAEGVEKVVALLAER